MNDELTAGEWRPEGRWIGDINGMLVGQCIVDFSRDQDDTKATLRANFSGAITEAAGVLRLSDPPALQLDAQGSGQGRIQAGFDLTILEMGPYRISGSWETSEGNAGVFALSPGPQAAPALVQLPAPKTPPPSSRNPLQIVQRTGTIARMRFFRDEVQDLCRLMQRLLNTSVEPIINADIGGKDIKMFGPDFWAQPTLPPYSDTVQLLINDGNTTAPPNSISITLSRNNSSFVVTGGDDVWVTGAFREIELAFEMRLGRWRGLRRFYERHALSFNGVALLLAIAYLPNLEFTQRLVMLCAAVALSFLVKIVHDATTTVRVYLKRDRKDSGKLFELPKYYTGLANAATIGAVTLLYQAMSQDKLSTWWKAFLKFISP